MSKAKNKQINPVEGKVARQPEDTLGGVEIILGKMLAPYIPIAGQAAYRALKGEEGVALRIAESWKEGEYYYLALSLSNVTENGVYLEEIWIDDPKDTPMDIVFKDRIGQWTPVKHFLPLLMEANDDAEKLTLRISDFEEEGQKVLEQRTTVTVKYKISILDEDKPTTFSKRIRIRAKKR